MFPSAMNPAAFRPRGVALLGVIWLIAILALACVTALRVISFDTDLAAAKIHGSRALQIAEMGVALGCHPQVKRSDPILQQYNEATGEGFQVRLASEGGRFNINFILLNEDKTLLRDIFTYWGVELDAAQAVADALGDWVDADDNVALNGAEAKDYEKLGRFNQPFNRPFYDVNEMRLVLGMDLVEAVQPSWRQWFTVWSGGPLDVNEATAEMIALAAEVRPEQAEIIPETVRGVDGARDTIDDVPFQNAAPALDLLGIDVNGRPDIAGRFTANDATFRIESIGYSGGSKRKIKLILRNRTGRPVLLERTEEIIP
jgi:type II secretory pathway component PulK